MLDPVRWDTELICCYDQAGPRYTSYPCALEFHEGVSEFELRQALKDSRQQLRPLALYVHLPFCPNLCYYCNCTKIITKDRGRTQPYLQRLEQEIRLIARQLDPKQPVRQLLLGGGTPTFLSHDELRQLMSCLREHFNLADDDSVDYGIEIDPREADWATMGLLRNLGFNRISLGVQALDPAVQRAVNRMQRLDETRAIIEAARTLQFRSINIDMMYGLPKQTPAMFAEAVAEVIAMQPDRLALYHYAHLPERFAAQRKINASELPERAAKLQMMQNSFEQLSAAGYRYIGMEQFALPDDELAIAQEEGQLRRTFQGYSSCRSCDLIGLGLSAISQIGTLYSQNSSELKEYQALLDAGQLPMRKGLHLTQDDQIRRAVIEHLLCDAQLEFAAIEQRFAIDFRHYFADIWPHLEQFAQDGLIELSDTKLDVCPVGRLLIHVLCLPFDKHRLAEHQQRFSRII